MGNLYTGMDTALKNYKQSPNSITYQEMIVAILLGAKSREAVKIPVIMIDETTNAKGYYILQGTDGKNYMALVTAGGNSPEIETVDGTIMSVIRALQQYPQIDGICLNPWEQQVFLPREQLEYILSQMR